MTVRARLTTDAVDSGTHWSKDSDLAALSRLFTGDPAVTTDHNGYYVTGAELDQAYAQQDGTDSIVAPRLVAKLNGAATLLIPTMFPSGGPGVSKLRVA